MGKGAWPNASRSGIPWRSGDRVLDVTDGGGDGVHVLPRPEPSTHPHLLPPSKSSKSRWRCLLKPRVSFPATNPLSARPGSSFFFAGREWACSVSRSARLLENEQKPLFIIYSGRSPISKDTCHITVEIPAQIEPNGQDIKARTGVSSSASTEPVRRQMGHVTCRWL